MKTELKRKFEHRMEKEGIRTQTGKGIRRRQKKKYGRNFASLLLGIEKMKPS